MSLEQHPLVTILTAVYNTGNHITDTLTSIKNQTYPRIEHIIIDDASSDNSADIVAAWIEDNSYNCQFIRHKANKGICCTINEAIGIAKGKYFAAIGDDFMLPYKVERDVAGLEANLDAAFCYSKMIQRHVNKNEEKGGDFYKGSDNLFDDYLSGKVSIAAPTVMYRRSIFNEVGLFDETLLFEDYDMFLRVLYKHKAIFLNYYSIIYNIFQSNYSIQHRRKIEVFNEFLYILDKKWKHLPRYKYYKSTRHEYFLSQLASNNKKEAVKHLAPALRLFGKKRLYTSLLRLLLVWK